MRVRLRFPGEQTGMLRRCDALDEILRDSQPKLAPVASTATRLCNKAQGWTEGTTLGSGDGGAPNPNGVVAGGDRRRPVFRPAGRNPVGAEGPCRAITHGWRRANPGLCCTTPLGEWRLHKAESAQPGLLPAGVSLRVIPEFAAWRVQPRVLRTLAFDGARFAAIRALGNQIAGQRYQQFIP